MNAYHRITVTAALFMAMTGSFTRESHAGEQEAMAAQLEILSGLGPGVHKVKRDENGALLSCVVVGQSRISTVLGPARGLQTARTSARLSAEKEFVKWFETNVRAVEYSGNQQIIMLESDGHTMTETGKAVETTAEAITAEAAGALRGLTILGVQQDGEGQLLTVVMGWKPEYAVSASEAQKISETGRQPSQAAPSARGITVDQNIPSQTTIADEAGEFF